MAKKEKAATLTCTLTSLKNSISIEFRAKAGMKENKWEQVVITEQSLEMLDAMERYFDDLVDLQNVVALIKWLLTSHPVVLD